MTLAELLPPERIVADLEATEPWPAIVELAEGLIETGAFPAASREALLASLRNREDQHSTGVGENRAIPHAFSPEIDEVVAAFGRSPAGIDFGAEDGKPVHFIVLFVVPEGQYDLHLRTLGAIAKVLNNKQVRRRLTLAANAEEIRVLLSQKSSRI